jgi:ParB family chromosome partitioning protein
MKRQALGKGLDVLLPQGPVRAAALIELDLDQIQPNPLQPRMQFAPEKLQELAASIKENGVLQPIVVRGSGGGYELVVGERRWRAARQVGLERIPAIVQNVSDEKMLELALVENIQRDELSPIEEGQAYQLLADQFALTHEEIAQRVGRSRTAVTNSLRLLRLPSFIQEKVMNEEMSMGHARALIPLSEKDQLRLAEQVIARGLSVRETERRAKLCLDPPKPRTTTKDPNIQAAEEKLEERWKTRVEIRRRGQRGQIVLHFHSPDDLERLYQDLWCCHPD